MHCRVIGKLVLAAIAATLLLMPVQVAWAEPSPVQSPATSAEPGFVRGAYGKDSSPSGSETMAAYGFNAVMADPYKQSLDPLAARGLKGVVWLGAWLNAPTCGFERDDATMRSEVAPIAGDPAILAYYLGDEPRVTECPGAPGLFKQRSDLVHSLDPGSRTFTVIQAFENGITHDYKPWAGVVDILGFDVYPCVKASSTCDFSTIDSAIADISRAGITRYWAILGDFQDCYYRLPTPAELGSQFDHWARSNMSGYLVFSWSYQSRDAACTGTSLDLHTDNLAVLKAENARTFMPAAGGAAEMSSSPISLRSSLAYVTSAGWLPPAGAAALLLCLAALIARGVRRRPR